MAAEKQFETKVKSYLQSIGIYAAGTPSHKMVVEPKGWFIKFWGGGYAKAGIPDLIICVNGFFIGCELKSSSGKPDDLQRKNIKMINQGGGIGIVLYPEGFDQFKKIVKGVISCNSHIQEFKRLKAAHSNTKCDILTS